MNKNRLEEVQAEILKIEKDPNLKKEPKDILKKKLQENKLFYFFLEIWYYEKKNIKRLGCFR